jgi:hypothetical protein
MKPHRTAFNATRLRCSFSLPHSVSSNYWNGPLSASLLAPKSYTSVANPAEKNIASYSRPPAFTTHPLASRALVNKSISLGTRYISSTASLSSSMEQHNKAVSSISTTVRGFYGERRSAAYFMARPTVRGLNPATTW